MSAQGHPPGCDHLRYCARCSAYVGDLATMRAAVERCAELETALARVTAERDEARSEAD